MKSVCPLCDKTKEIIESHLIPSWAYKRICDESHPVLVDANKNRALFSNKEFKKKLLCQECDGGIIGSVEDKLARWFDIDGWPNSRLTQHIKYESLRKFDQEISLETIKYFALSVIWRSHHMGMGINLGPYAIQIRKYLIGESCSLESMELCIGLIEGANNRIISLPATAKNGMVFCHGFSFLGFSFKLFVSKKLPEFAIKIGTLHKDNYVMVIMYENMSDMKKIEELVLRSEPRRKLIEYSNQQT